MKLSRILKLQKVSRGTEIIAQGRADDHLILILSGEFSIEVNTRPIARRSAGQHVGEMTLIDPSARRSASVVALEDSVVARIDEPDFVALANRRPELWRAIAVELGAR